jgi:hypothetical protein
MKELNVDQMQELVGGGFVDGFCITIGAGSVLYAMGAVTNW